MSKKELFSLDDLKKVIDIKKGFLVIRRSDDLYKELITIHNSLYFDETERYKISSYDVDGDIDFDKYNEIKYYFYNSFDEILVDFPNADSFLHLRFPKFLT